MNNNDDAFSDHIIEKRHYANDLMQISWCISVYNDLGPLLKWDHCATDAM